MAFTIRQLQFFVAVAEQGTVSGAAKALSISQSSVTEGVKALEGDLGVELFLRRSRSLEITHTGHQFLRHAKKILSDVSDARNVFDSSPKSSTGKLSLGVTSLVAGEYLEHLLIGGELDVAVLVTSNLRNRNAMQVETLDVSAFRLWLPMGHELASKEAITLDDVAREPLIMLSVDEIEEGTLVATGAGVALLPNLVYRPWSLEGDRIEIRDVSGDLPAVQVGLAWRRGAPLSEIGLDFVRLAQTALSFR
jgi:DNA-binding transcriptional LysR family regulator